MTDRVGRRGGSEGEPTGPPTDPPRLRIWEVVKGAAGQFNEDNLTDMAAALTYYAVLSIFPALLVVVSLVDLASEQTVTSVIDDTRTLIPRAAHDILNEAVTDLENSRRPGLAAGIGVLGAIWSASGFVGAFIRASNTIFDVPERRPLWKIIPLRLLLTVVVLVLLAASVLIVVLTGGVTRWAQRLLEVPAETVTIWNIAKWPVLAMLLMLILALLHWAGPNVRQHRFGWVTPGDVLGIGLWLVASAGFALYVSNFSSYNRIYGTVAGVIVLLIWIWVSNLAILFGAELDAELARARGRVSRPGQAGP